MSTRSFDASKSCTHRLLPLQRGDDDAFPSFRARSGLVVAWSSKPMVSLLSIRRATTSSPIAFQSYRRRTACKYRIGSQVSPQRPFTCNRVLTCRVHCPEHPIPTFAGQRRRRRHAVTAVVSRSTCAAGAVVSRFVKQYPTKLSKCVVY